jgi:hypothetical protein
MQAPTSDFGFSAEHRPTLADELRDVAFVARDASVWAIGEYIPQMSRELELRSAYRDASRACAALEQLAPRVVRLDGADDAMQLVKVAIMQLEEGRAALHETISVDVDLPGHKTTVIDSISTGASGARFRDAADLIVGLADLAMLEGLSPDEAFRRLLER